MGERGNRFFQVVIRGVGDLNIFGTLFYFFLGRGEGAGVARRCRGARQGWEDG